MKKQTKKLKRTAVSKKNKANRLKKRFKFLPALLIALFATYLWAQPAIMSLGIVSKSTSPGVLAKATNVSHAGLLSETNKRRGANGAGSLSANSLLNSAAQAKANHMIANQYWAHETPDGKQPWWFITNAGYQYLAAGENLAYGYMSSESTITGWMNSPSHRANMLNNTYTEVGFGIADTDDYVWGGSSHGPQTIVVAMYAKPQAAAAPAPAPAATKPTTTTSKPASKPASTAQPETAAPTPTPEPVAEETPAEEAPVEEQISVGSSEQPIMAAPAKVTRIQLLTGGNAIWSATFVALAVIAAVGLWVVHKGVHIRRMVVAGERFLTHHIHLDLTVLAIIYLGSILLMTSGTIR